MSARQRKKPKNSITLPEAGRGGTNYGLRLSLADTHDGEVCIHEDSSIFTYRDWVLFLARHLFGLKREWSAMEKWQQSAVVMFARKCGRHNSFAISKSLEGAIAEGDVVTRVVTTNSYRYSEALDVDFHPSGKDGKQRLKDILRKGHYPIELSLKRTARVPPSIHEDCNLKGIRLSELHFGGNKLFGCKAFDWDRFVFNVSQLPCLEYLDLDRTGAGRAACEAVAGYLSQGGCRLHTLLLRENHIDDECVDLLIPALEYNQSLRKLFLQKNRFTSVGRGRFLELLGHAPSPHLTYHSNHTLCDLRLDVSGVDEPLRSFLKLNHDGLNDGTPVDVRAKRRNKILLAHCLRRPLDVAAHADLDVRLMPRLLAWFGVNVPGRDARFHAAIHNVHTPFDDRGARFRALHSLVRGWNVQALFGNPSPERRRTDELAGEVARLRGERDAAVAALRAENAGLAEENRRLREEVESLGGGGGGGGGYSWWNWKRRRVS